MNEMPKDRSFEGQDRPHATPNEPHAMKEDVRPPQRPADDKGRRRIARLLGLGAIIVLGGLVFYGVKSHADKSSDAKSVLEERQKAIPSVRVLAAKEITGPRTIELPGNITAFDQATIYARATGYIGSRNVDIGSKVKKGDVLAKIAAPDLDQQLAQAKAQLEQLNAAVLQAQANADLGVVTNQRTARLVTQGWSSAQQGDQDRLNSQSTTAAVAVAKANVQAQEANVRRLTELTGFEDIVAPFDGVITSRLIDVGSLVTADAASGTSLFAIQRTDVLRVQAYVPQNAYFGLKDGDHASVTIPELPGKSFDGVVARNASSLAAGTRTLLTEVDIDNRNGELTAGLYSIIHLKVNRPNPIIKVPSQAVIFNKDGLFAAIAGSDGKAEMRKLNVEYDNGADVEVRDGLKAGDKIILNPPATINNGMQVKVQES